MLQAKSHHGVLVTLAALTKAGIDPQKAEQQYYCPVRKRQVIIKAGSRMITHFAHKSTLHCSSSEGGEGPYHEQGKLLLYQWLKSQHLQEELEAHLHEINQRPDLLLTINEKKIAIEFQCARIPIGQIKQRNK